MALANYTDLKAIIATYLNDTGLTTEIIDFINLAESEINRRVTLLQAEQLTTATYTTSNTTRRIQMPAGFIELRSLEIRKTSGTDLDYVTIKYKTPSQMNLSYNSTTGKPRYYTVRDQLEFERLPDVSYKLRMHMIKKWDLATDTTNWLMTNHPNLYLYLTLIHAQVFLADKEMIPHYVTMSDHAIEHLNMIDHRSKNDGQLDTSELASMNTNRYDINSDG